MTDQLRAKRIERAQLKVLFQCPFFAPGVARLPVEFSTDPGIPTACTDGNRILWDREWFDSLEDQQVVTVYCHEVAHCMLGHLWRIPPGAQMGDWNIAIDHAVNLMLEDWSKEVMSKRLADPFPFPPGDYCKDPQYRGMSEEVIYSKIPKQPQGSGGKGGKGNPKPGAGRPNPFGEIVNGNNGTQDPAAVKQLLSDWDNTLGQAMEIAKQRGTMPAGLERQIQKHFDPGIPWYELLRQWVMEQANDDWNWMKPNRLYSEGDFMLPVLESERVGLIVMAKDTSGSITPDILAHFTSEEQGALDSLRPARLIDVCCDAAVQSSVEYHVGDEISPIARGGGGTDFKPVFKHIEQLGEQPKCLVYLTDLYGSFPEKAPEYPVLWCVFGNPNPQAPFGTVINVET